MGSQAWSGFNWTPDEALLNGIVGGEIEVLKWMVEGGGVSYDVFAQACRDEDWSWLRECSTIKDKDKLDAWLEGLEEHYEMICNKFQEETGLSIWLTNLSNDAATDDIEVGPYWAVGNVEVFTPEAQDVRRFLHFVAYVEWG